MTRGEFNKFKPRAPPEMRASSLRDESEMIAKRQNQAICKIMQNRAKICKNRQDSKNKFNNMKKKNSYTKSYISSKNKNINNLKTKYYG